MTHISNPFASFKPKHKGPGRFADLDGWEPSSRYAHEEQPGIKNWNGPAPPGILTKTNTPPPAPLEKIFGDLFQRLWVTAQVSQTAQRNPSTFLAQTRHSQPGMPAAAPYRPVVAPTVTNPNAPRPPSPAARPLPAYPTGPARPLPPGGRTLPPPPGAHPRPVPPPPQGPNAHLNGLAKDWELHTKLERYTGYAFRGDRRDPTAIKAAGGFLPSSTRTDDDFIKGAVYEQFCNYMQRRFDRKLASTVTPQQFLAMVRQSTASKDDQEAFRFYSNWRAIVKSEELHLGRMLAQESLKAYISTTRAVPVAKGFAKRGTGPEGQKYLGWVYCVAVNGGFLVPERKPDSWTETFGEAEIAVPNGIPWHAVAGARAVDFAGKFIGDVYVRKGFENIDKPAFEAIFKLLSGKKQ